MMILTQTTSWAQEIIPSAKITALVERLEAGEAWTTHPHTWCPRIGRPRNLYRYVCLLMSSLHVQLHSSVHFSWRCCVSTVEQCCLLPELFMKVFSVHSPECLISVYFHNCLVFFLNIPITVIVFF